MAKCSVEGCDREVEKMGMCAMHYRREYRKRPGVKERERAIEAAWRETNREKARERARRSYYKHQDTAKARHYAYTRTIKGRFSNSVSNAKHIGREWTLTLEQFAALVSQACHYCGNPLHETGAGLDRIDNSRGYVLDNVVPCCKVCNLLRLNELTPEETGVLALVLRAMREGKPLNSYLTSTGVTWAHSATPPA
jgi:hypothetical protein